MTIGRLQLYFRQKGLELEQYADKMHTLQTIKYL